MPFSMAAVALPTAAMFASASAFSVAKRPASFSRSVVASAMVALAAARSV